MKTGDAIVFVSLRPIVVVVDVVVVVAKMRLAVYAAATTRSALSRLTSKRTTQPHETPHCWPHNLVFVSDEVPVQVLLIEVFVIDSSVFTTADGVDAAAATFWTVAEAAAAAVRL